jgi:hypothetical protein
MIGGTDIILENFSLDAAATLEAVARVARGQWSDAVFVDASSGRRFASFAAAEFGALHELFVFRDEASRERWEQSGLDDTNADTMIYAITGRNELTLVIADPQARSVRAVVQELEQLLAYGTPGGSWRSAAA